MYGNYSASATSRKTFSVAFHDKSYTHFLFRCAPRGSAAGGGSRTRVTPSRSTGDMAHWAVVGRQELKAAKIRAAIEADKKGLAVSVERSSLVASPETVQMRAFRLGQRTVGPLVSERDYAFGNVRPHKQSARRPSAFVAIGAVRVLAGLRVVVLRGPLMCSALMIARGCRPVATRTARRTRCCTPVAVSACLHARPPPWPADAAVHRHAAAMKDWSYYRRNHRGANLWIGTKCE